MWLNRPIRNVSVSTVYSQQAAPYLGNRITRESLSMGVIHRRLGIVNIAIIPIRSVADGS